MAPAPHWEIALREIGRQTRERYNEITLDDVIYRALQLGVVGLVLAIVWVLTHIIVELGTALAALAGFVVSIAGWLPLIGAALFCAPVAWIAWRVADSVGRSAPDAPLPVDDEDEVPVPAPRPAPRPRQRATAPAKPKAAVAEPAELTEDTEAEPPAIETPEYIVHNTERWLAVMFSDEVGQSLGCWTGAPMDLMAAAYDIPLEQAICLFGDDKCAVSWLLHIYDPDGWTGTRKRHDPGHKCWDQINEIYGRSFIKSVIRMNDQGMSLKKIAQWAQPVLRRKGLVR